MSIAHEEWLKQADYDMDTAEFMLGGGRCFYAVFMSHLSIEKAVKGLYQFKLGEVPPKIHNLMYILSRTGSNPPEEIEKFLIRLNEANIATRYPDDIAAIGAQYTTAVTRDILGKAKEALQWIKRQF